jgi:tRNA (cmo5U34)-methyltransferase
MNIKQDKVFASKQKVIKPFKFDHDVAEVFDDMVSRSVPFYEEIHRISADMVLRFYEGSGTIIDLGCSTGTTISLLNKELEARSQKASFVAVDTSAPMLELAKDKCSDIQDIKYLCEDMCNTNFENAEVVILNYTLQFLSLDKRQELIKNIYKGLRPGGIILISEKIHSDQSSMQEIITDLYYDFKKRNGYSELEISQKREALENVLITLTPKEQINMLESAGFTGSEMIFRWYNFSTYLGRKENA